ncbi:WD40 repeat-like protein [Tilletiaria anomala UBC 951]|uniref:WD40 repeat-like protein n=1 Tax=Tilletiaria anomala (strain ATCC 24038 / CBS 436.72 / UBC 951) TaxID=1037660 RepID=A0A066W1I5_TILAU|nr:WD40 repeat-like protein [Tilletiaria anomala UBC 951]KDN44919.1 WD40 repeat-like protein [Tilletiaria anomala UBC 951]
MDLQRNLNLAESSDLHEHDEPEGINAEDIEEVVELGDDDGDEPMDEDEDEENGGYEVQAGDLDDHDGGDDMQQTIEDTSIAAFHDHRSSVFTVALHPSYPNPPLAISGGEDDAGYIWSTHSGEPLAKLSGHTDSVIAAGFNFKGDMAATGGMDGRIRVWRRRGGEDEWGAWEFLANLEGPDEVVWIEWHPRGNVIAAGGTDSTVWMWTLPLGKTMQVFSGHTAAVTTGSFTPDGKKLITASEDGSLIVWDPRSPAPVAKLQASDARFNLPGGITKLRISPDSRTVIIGGAAGHLRIVSIAHVDDEGSIAVVATLAGHEEGESVEAIEFIDLFGVTAGSAPTPSSSALSGAATATVPAKPVTTVITGATDGKGYVWDISTGKMRNSISHDAAITSIVVHSRPGAAAMPSPLFSTSSADHTIKTWDARSGACIGTQTGFTDGVLALAVGRDDGYTQGAETGGIGAYARGGGAGWKLVGAGDEGVALVFRV